MLTYSLDCQIVGFYLNAPQPPTHTPSIRILFGQFHSQEFGAGWWCMSTIPVLGGPRREEPKFDASPSYLMRPPSQKNWEREKKELCFVLLIFWFHYYIELFSLIGIYLHMQVTVCWIISPRQLQCLCINLAHLFLSEFLCMLLWSIPTFPVLLVLCTCVLFLFAGSLDDILLLEIVPSFQGFYC